MLIDMENVAPGHMEEIMAQAKRFGTVVHRSGFGATTDKKWTEARRRHGILCGRQSHVNAGEECRRHGTHHCRDGPPRRPDDHRVLHRLERQRLHARRDEAERAGRLVLGFGENKAPSPFVAACDHFETIGKVEKARRTEDTSAKKPVAQPATKPNGVSSSQAVPVVTVPSGNSTANGNARTEFLDLVKAAAAKAKQHDGWIHTSVVGSQIRKIKPKIQYKDYGHKTLIGILETYPNEIETNGPKERKQIRLRG